MNYAEMLASHGRLENKNAALEAENAQLREELAAARLALSKPDLSERCPQHAAAEPVTFNFEAHLANQAEWSMQTFGPGMRTAGVCDHIRKELLEIESDPGDLKEWIDVVILGLDGAWRCGGSPRQIIDGIVAKQAKNEKRNWPDWRTMDPNKAIEHDRSGEISLSSAAPVARVSGQALSDERENFEAAYLEFLGEKPVPNHPWFPNGFIEFMWQGVAGKMWQARAARAAAQPAPVAPSEDAAVLERIEGDLLPPIGSKVLIHLGRQDAWVEHTVAGYYVWAAIKGQIQDGEKDAHRVFVRVVDESGYENARLLSDVRPCDAAMKACK